MCGFTGFWAFDDNTSNYENLNHIVKNMANQITTRGPDSFGTWCNINPNIAIGHRRLAILDLTECGHQPMVSQSKKFVLAYNGEIYNAPELKKELISNGINFKGHSDTEVLLAACEAWGIENAINRFIGMFAFALWNTAERQLTLVRDRIGIKPLYWGFHQQILFFGSQLKSFFVHPKWQGKLNHGAINNYLAFNYVPSPTSIIQGIHKLEPGTFITIQASKTVKISYYWSLKNVVNKRKTNITQKQKQKTEQEYLEKLEFLLKDAVKLRMLADVPLGAFLSGGIDSSTVVALMQSQSSRPIKTFTIGFAEQDYNEAQYAKNIAHHLGTNHFEMYVTAKQTLDVIPNIPTYYDEPFADVSQIPTFLVSQFAANQVKVVLSGDGGDELFAGYNRYFLGDYLWKKLHFLPAWLQILCAKSIHSMAPSSWDKLSKILPMLKHKQRFGDKIHKFAALLPIKNQQEFYKNLVTHWKNKNIALNQHVNTSLNFIEQMQYTDLKTYLPDDILTKVDRASMAVGLEARVPMLDHRLIEFSWDIPLSMKIKNNYGKIILKQLLHKYIPAAYFTRPKMGFGVPIDSWLRGPLKDWAETLLAENRLKQEGILDPTPIRHRLQQHMTGSRNWQYSLWGVLMFQAWYEKYKSYCSQ